MLKNNKHVLKGTCVHSGCKKCQFIADPTATSGGDIHSLIGKLPRPKGGFTLKNHKYTGPWNPLDTQLDEHDQPLPGQEPFNKVDEIALHHDICYRDNPTNKSKGDAKMLSNLSEMKPTNTREKLDKALVSSIIGVKHKLGLGLDIMWNDQLAEELHKPVRKHFQKRRVMVDKIDEIWAADLVDMQKLSRDNKGFKYHIH